MATANKNGKPKLMVQEDVLFDSSFAALLLKEDAKAMVTNLVEAGEIGLSTVRALVELYYDSQHYRIEASNRVRALQDRSEEEHIDIPTGLPEWLAARQLDTEKAIGKLLDQYTQQERTGMGAWAREIVGVGPIISAGLLALIDMNVATSPSKIWRFFGLDPTVVWKKGEKRPWNATGKVLCWKLGDSFMKNHNNANCVYGKLYEQRKALETARDEQGLNAETAKKTLTTKTFKNKEVKAVYESGHIPLGRIEQRARRWAVKIFLVHWWSEAYRRKFKKEPPDPYVIDKLGHQTVISAR
jgi:hypothetical protein